MRKHQVLDLAHVLGRAATRGPFVLIEQRQAVVGQIDERHLGRGGTRATSVAIRTNFLFHERVALPAKASILGGCEVMACSPLVYRVSQSSGAGFGVVRPTATHGEVKVSF